MIYWRVVIAVKENYQLTLDRELERIRQSGRVPRLLLHVCCAPCSSYVLEYLTAYMDITLYDYNPNITPESEYRFRERELRRLIGEMPLPRAVGWQDAPYDPASFDAVAAGMEDLPEGGARCAACYRLRLERTFRQAAADGYDYVTTTLSISPYKNADWLNAIGRELAKRYGVPYLVSDFKKRDGYRRSCALSKQYNLYRQDYCGCIYSKKEAENRKKN
ncbi:MAG: epoxyqueuosine reductase QueH [Acutalibacteraceae bacterium]|jgi:predicted adenine nucleotide alpha hydrolase (AANH) superfamily ATPase